MAAGLVVDGLKDGRLQDVAVQWVGRLVVEHLVDAAGIGFGAETAVQTPFLEPGGFEGDTGDFRDAAEHVGQTEGDKSTLVGTGEVGVAWIDGRFEAHQDEAGVVECLTRVVAVNVFAQVPAGGEVTGDGIKRARAGRSQAALIAQPFGGGGHVVIALGRDAIRLGNRLGAARDGQEQELGKIMAVEFARSHAAE